jgi:hypothetical protein
MKNLRLLAICAGIAVYAAPLGLRTAAATIALVSGTTAFLVPLRHLNPPLSISKSAPTSTSLQMNESSESDRHYDDIVDKKIKKVSRDGRITIKDELGMMK